MEYMEIFLTSASVVRLFLAGQGELSGFLALGDFGIFFWKTHSWVNHPPTLTKSIYLSF